MPFLYGHNYGTNNEALKNTLGCRDAAVSVWRRPRSQLRDECDQTVISGGYFHLFQRALRQLFWPIYSNRSVTK